MKTIYTMKWMVSATFAFVPRYTGCTKQNGKRAGELLEQFNLTEAGKRPSKHIPRE